MWRDVVAGRARPRSMPLHACGSVPIIMVPRYLTMGFHVAVRLCGNKSQMTSKCGKNKKSDTLSYKVTHEAEAEGVTDV